MAKLVSPFTPSGDFPIDIRLNMTLDQMKNVHDVDFPSGYMTVNSEEDKPDINGLWIYSKTYSADDTTGRWRKIIDKQDIANVWNTLSSVSAKVDDVWNIVTEVSAKTQSVWSTVNDNSGKWNSIPTWTPIVDDKLYGIKNNVWSEIPQQKDISAGPNIDIYDVSGINTISAKNTTDLEYINGLINFVNGVLTFNDEI